MELLLLLIVVSIFIGMFIIFGLAAITFIGGVSIVV